MLSAQILDGETALDLSSPRRETLRGSQRANAWLLDEGILINENPRTGTLSVRQVLRDVLR